MSSPPGDPAKASIKDIKVYGFSQHNKNAVCSVYLANCLVGDLFKVVQVTVRLTKGVNDALEQGQSPHIYLYCKKHWGQLPMQERSTILTYLPVWEGST